MTGTSPPGSPPVPPAFDRRRSPAHVAWVASGAERWEGGAGEMTAAVEAALAELVEGALALGIGWLTVYAPPARSGRGTGRGVEAARAAAEALGRWPEGAGAARPGVVARGLGPEGTTAPTEHPAEHPSGPAEHPSVTVSSSPTLVVTAAVGYSGRGEIVEAVRRLAAQGVAASAVDEGAIGRNLYDPAMPDPDLVVRSGGDRRISDLLLWEMAYSELVFLDDPWPAVDRGHLFDAVVEYQRRDRRYGGLVGAVERA